MDVSIHDGEVPSYHIVFSVPHLYQNQLAQLFFLADDSCLFGDNIYVNTTFIAKPYSDDTDSDMQTDAYNFYHSQL